VSDFDRRLEPERLLDVARSQVKRGAKTLDPSWPPRDAAVHDARKRLKKARAALRLARPVLGERRFARDNERLRDAGRPLGAVRDAAMLIALWNRMQR